MFSFIKSFDVWTRRKICRSRVLLILNLQMSPVAIHLYCPFSLYFVFKMHSKSDDLGYINDQERQIFQGLCHLNPPPGLCPGPAGGGAQSTTFSPPPPSSTPLPPELPSSKVLAVTYLFNIFQDLYKNVAVHTIMWLCCQVIIYTWIQYIK